MGTSKTHKSYMISERLRTECPCRRDRPRIGVFFVIGSQISMLPEHTRDGHVKAQDHQRQLADFPRRCGLHAAAVGGSIHVANIYERRMTLGTASTLVAPSIMRQHLKLSAFDMLRVCGALL